jgi:hypothetical protein
VSEDLPLFRWRPPVKVVPFPAGRRVGFIRKNAAQAARYRRPEASANYIDAQVSAALSRLAKAGVDPDVAAADAAALERALWAEFARITARSGRDGAA